MDFFLCFAVVLIAVVAIVWIALAIRENAEAFDNQFPPISDAEFLARCRPGTDPQIALKVRRIVAEQLGVEYARIYPSSRFVEDLGAD